MILTTAVFLLRPGSTEYAADEARLHSINLMGALLVHVT